MIATCNNIQGFLFHRGLTLIVQVLTPTQCYPMIFIAVVNMKRKLELITYFLRLFQTREQSDRRAQAKLFPPPRQAVHVLRIRKVLPRLRILPNPFARNGMGHEKRSPFRKEGRQPVPQRELHGLGRQVGLDRGAVQAAPDEIGRPFRRVLLEVMGGVQGQAPAVGIARDEEGHVVEVLARQFTKRHEIIAIDLPFATGDVESRSLGKSVAERVQAVDGNARIGHLSNPQGLIGVAIANFRAESGLAAYPVVPDHNGLDFDFDFCSSSGGGWNVLTIVESFALICRY